MANIVPDRGNNPARKAGTWDQNNPFYTSAHAMASDFGNTWMGNSPHKEFYQAKVFHKPFIGGGDARWHEYKHVTPTEKNGVKGINVHGGAGPDFLANHEVHDMKWFDTDPKNAPLRNEQFRKQQQFKGKQ